MTYLTTAEICRTSLPTALTSKARLCCTEHSALNVGFVCLAAELEVKEAHLGPSVVPGTSHAKNGGWTKRGGC